MDTIRLSSAACLALGTFLFAACGGRPAPDTIYIHGQVATLDPAQPAAQALAVTGDKVSAVGADADIQSLAGRHTRVVDLHGSFLLPGFNDAHTHEAQSGMAKLELDLSGTRSLGEFQQRIRAYAATLPPGEWLLAERWDHTAWPGQQFPTRQDIDPFTGDHPALLNRLDGHAEVVNTCALQLAGITRDTPTPNGGKIGKDAKGEPNGLFFDNALSLVASKLPAPSPARRRQALELAMRDALAHGVTSVQDYSTWDDFLTYEQMEKDGGLRYRVSEWLTFNDPLPTLVAERAHHDAHDPWLRTGMLKGFMDGSLGSRTAAMLAPYSDEPSNSGLPRYDQSQLDHMATERMHAGFQLGFHAIGDRAARMALAAFEVAAAAQSSHEPRNRIEHLQVVAATDLPRMKKLGVVASVQPSHLLDDDRWAEARIGAQRARSSYLLKTLLQDGIPVAFGTDSPVEPIDPMLGLYSAVTRASVDGKIHYQPQEAISMPEALHAYTLGSAYAEFREGDLGSLTPGKYADFTVLSRNLLTAAPVDILSTTVNLTVVGGRTMYAVAGWQ